MGLGSLLVRRENGILIATIHRPEKLNAVNKEVFDELKALVERLESDHSARALILTGHGNKAFCVGADLKERQGMNEKDVVVRLDFVRQIYSRIEKLAIPVIAALNGMALGGGLELALAADLRICTQDTTLGLPEVDLAIIPGNGGTQRLSRLVGMPKALEMVLLAKKISADEAFSVGLVNQVVSFEQLMPTALQWGKKIMESGPIAIKQAKLAIREGAHRKLEDSLLWELECYKPCLQSKDRLEGLKAFAEKRKPNYLGV